MLNYKNYNLAIFNNLFYLGEWNRGAENERFKKNYTKKWC